MNATEWNFADIYAAIAQRVPDRPCQVQGGRVVTWGDFDRRANALAADLISAGLAPHSKVAQYLYNCPEYVESVVAAFKMSAVPVNTNFRYGPSEILYLFDNADVEAVVFHASFADVLEGIRDRLPNVRRWYAVADESGQGPHWAIPYEQAVNSGSDAPDIVATKSGDDMMLLYTGGTTGMPKGVMWRQDDLVNAFGAGGSPVLGTPPARDLEELVGRVAPEGASQVMLVACPLMHGTGLFSALNVMLGGGCVVSLPNHRLDVSELFGEVERLGVTAIIIVGQAFAGPMLDHLDENPERYDLSSVALITSSGVMWGHDNKQGLIGHMPDVVLLDAYGSSEAVGAGFSVSTGEGAEATARFTLGANCAVFTDDGRRVDPGSDEIGMIAIGGFIPLGYYKDPVKSENTFRTFEGRRWSIPGDFAEVRPDGSLHLLGRGSVCINTGGEKVFPEEVEEVLRTHADVRDVVAVGLPDERFGELICAVVEPATGAQPDLEILAAHVRKSLAAFKAPRRLVVVDTIGRAANGKVDYKRLREVAATQATD